MKSKKITLSLELAKRMYNGKDSELKALALENYPELNMKITDRIRSFQDVLEIAGRKASDFESCDAENKAPMALKKLRLIQEILVEGWKPDWSNSNQAKYAPWFRRNASGDGFVCFDYDFYFTSTAVGSRLCFPNADLAKFAATIFIEEYNDFLN